MSGRVAGMEVGMATAALAATVPQWAKVRMVPTTTVYHKEFSERVHV
jgi:hypothetical protein